MIIKSLLRSSKIIPTYEISVILLFRDYVVNCRHIVKHFPAALRRAGNLQFCLDLSGGKQLVESL